jgi:hypothetical protein
MQEDVAAEAEDDAREMSRGEDRGATLASEEGTTTRGRRHVAHTGR